jgi:hypothetical protein
LVTESSTGAIVEVVEWGLESNSGESGVLYGGDRRYDGGLEAAHRLRVGCCVLTAATDLGSEAELLVMCGLRRRSRGARREE